MDSSIARKNPGGFYLAVGMICAAVTALQVLQSRIFSVVTWYHLAFLTISIAMFGLTLGAIEVYRGVKEEQRRNLGKLLGESSISFGIFAVAMLLVQMCFPIIDRNLKTIVFTLPLVAGVSAACYYYAGKIVSLCLTRSSLPVGKVYAADMTGAALGCLMAIGMMKIVDAPSAVLMIAGSIIAASFMFYRPGIKQSIMVLILALGIGGLGIVNASMDKRPIYPLWTKGFSLKHAEINYEEWNPISRITVSPPIPDLPAYIPGLSPIYKIEDIEYQYLRVDSAAYTPVIKFDGKSWDDVSFVEYDVTNLVHYVPGIKSFGIIGAGGGRDILAALYFGAKRVVALDINNIQVKLLTEIPEYRSYTNLWWQPGVRIVNSEARNWFTQNSDTFDAIQMSLIDTWISSAAGAFSLMENSLYTVDAWKLFLGHLNPEGLFTVSRFHKDASACNDLCRLGTITAAALLETGKTEPWRHVFVAHSGQIITYVIGRDPLTESQLDGMHRAAERLQYTIIASPRQKAMNGHLEKILHARSEQDITNAIADLPFDVSPTTDRRPFFFNQARIWNPLQVIRQTGGGMFFQNLHGHAVATVNLYAIIVFSFLASLLVLVLPFRKALKLAPMPFIRAGTAYFMLIGLGFMFVEITLMQMMSMFLGHPVYALGIVLFSLILSTGVGSLASEWFPLDSRKRIVCWALTIAAYIMMLSASINILMGALIEESFPVRVALCAGLIFPCGAMMGFAFPTGMRLTERMSDSLTPWFWGINGAAGVVASALSVFISIGFGLPVTLMTAALCYALLAIPALRLLKK
ncbi:MAG: hypothetical protein HY370_05390 [Proteobacteria bacterium]|nr:hypothetical protein [Pseudomonadota bacterium]